MQPQLGEHYPYGKQAGNSSPSACLFLIALYSLDGDSLDDFMEFTLSEDPLPHGINSGNISADKTHQNPSYGNDDSLCGTSLSVDDLNLDDDNSRGTPMDDNSLANLVESATSSRVDSKRTSLGDSQEPPSADGDPHGISLLNHDSFGTSTCFGTPFALFLLGKTHQNQINCNDDNLDGTSLPVDDSGTSPDDDNSCGTSPESGLLGKTHQNSICNDDNLCGTSLSVDDYGTSIDDDNSCETSLDDSPVGNSHLLSGNPRTSSQDDPSTSENSACGDQEGSLLKNRDRSPDKSTQKEAAINQKLKSLMQQPNNGGHETFLTKLERAKLDSYVIDETQNPSVFVWSMGNFLQWQGGLTVSNANPGQLISAVCSVCLAYGISNSVVFSVSPQQETVLILARDRGNDWNKKLGQLIDQFFDGATWNFVNRGTLLKHRGRQTLYDFTPHAATSLIWRINTAASIAAQEEVLDMTQAEHANLELGGNEINNVWTY